jgi:hypothetical protein
MSKKPKSKIEISFEVAAFLADAVEDMIESAEDHLEWLEAQLLAHLPRRFPRCVRSCQIS